MNFASQRVLETFYGYVLHECSGCRLQFWNPRKMPDARWYSAMYGGRNSRVLPLESGHHFFLADALAPRCGRLLDVGCGTGNFLRAAADSGYLAAGIELDPAAAAFARRFCPRSRLFALPLESFRSQHPNEVFDVVTFFEVLEHQADPNVFLSEIRSCLRPRGFIALSVPNRDRWQTSMDPLDYPPNHFLRWNSQSLRNAMKAHGFSVLSIKKETPALAYVAQQINGKFRSGISRLLAPGLPSPFRDEIQQDTGQQTQRHPAPLSLRTHMVQLLGRAKYASCFPIALAAIPFVKWRGLVGPYLYCLARKLD
ncbi:MAG TPA: class I SAM-dependent methyltransferase [Candidatus Acidoferrum sp.]|jgi:SAM-dependent methyltransferase